MRISLFLPILLFAASFPAGARAHIQLSSPTARYAQDNNGLKTAPCGSGSRTGVVTKLTPGQTVTVTWKESVPHAGHYRIALAASDSTFVEPTDLSIPNPLPSWDLVDGIPDKTGTQTYSQSVQIPQRECTACVLQLIQVMSAGTDGTNTGPFSGVYHACADVSISAAFGDAGFAAEVFAADGSGPESGNHDAPANDGAFAHDGSVAGSGGSRGMGGADSGGMTSAPGGASGVGSGGAAEAGGAASYGGAEQAGNGGLRSGGSPVGGSTGTASQSGGASGGAGGRGGAASVSSGGRGEATGEAGDAKPSGCSCDMAASIHGRSAFAIFALLALAFGYRRRPFRAL